MNSYFKLEYIWIYKLTPIYCYSLKKLLIMLYIQPCSLLMFSRPACEQCASAAGLCRWQHGRWHDRPSCRAVLCLGPDGGTCTIPLDQSHIEARAIHCFYDPAIRRMVEGHYVLPLSVRAFVRPSVRPLSKFGVRSITFERLHRFNSNLVCWYIISKHRSSSIWVTFH